MLKWNINREKEQVFCWIFIGMTVVAFVQLEKELNTVTDGWFNAFVVE